MSLTLAYYGFNYVDYYNGEYANNDTLPEVAQTGADSVALTPDFGIDVANSTVYAGGDTTDSIADLTLAIDEASTNGMTAFVRPLIDILYPQASHSDPGTYYVPDSFYYDGYADSGYNPAVDSTYAGDTPAGVTPASVPANAGNLINYRGELAFTDEGGDLKASTFFGSPTTVGSYDYVIVQEAEAAQAAGAKLYSIGTELDQLADDTNPAVERDWDNLIADVRAVFSGELTYSANWATADQVTFWNQLDYVGIDGYVPLSNTTPNDASQNPSLASLIAAWDQPSDVQIAYSGGVTVSQQLGGLSAIDAFDEIAQQSIDKQFIFTEIGYPNDTSAAADPTGGSETGVADPSLQAELYQAFFDAWGSAQQTAEANGGLVDGIPYSLVGAYFWDWNPDTSAGGYDGWSPEENALAASVINANFEAPPPPPTGLALSASSDSGVQGDGVTYVTTPTIIGEGTAGDTVTLYDGSAVVGSGTVGSNGDWSIVIAAPLSLGSNSLTATETDGSGNVSAASAALSLSIVQPPTADFTGTGYSDILFQNTDGTVGIWEMNGLAIESTGVVSNPGTAWQAIGTGDFTGNGMSGILFQNTDGTVGIWEMNGFGIGSSAAFLNPGTDWQVKGSGDFFGNGQDDVLFQNTNGTVGIWQMNGLNIVDTAALVNPGTDWQVKGAGDFFGNGQDDILFQNTDGTVGIWEMNGFNIVASTVLLNPGTDWQVKGTGDFFGNGMSDILFQNTDGTVGIWEMNGFNIVATAAEVNPGASWQVIGTGDFFGNGKDDILFQNSNGTVGIWEMNGSNLVGSTALLNPGTSWHVLAG